MMKINIKNLAVLLMVYCMTAMSSYATKLPPYILQTLKTELPKASVRFDGLVTLPDGTVYLPVLPSNPQKNPQGKVVLTYPSSKKLSQLPDVVVFDSDFALLKVIKNSNGQITLTDTKNIPLTVKTGIFPQDMLVPPGLVVPEELKIMMGDLSINVQNSRVNNILKDAVQVNASENKIFTPLPCLKDKTFLITTLDSKVVNVVPSNSVTPKYSLTLENLPKFIQPVTNDKYLLVAAAGKTYIEVADIDQEVIAKKIDLSFQPTEILLNSDKTKAYVAVADDQSIFVIDIKTMALLEKIKVKGYPRNISISANDKTIVYSDRNTGDIYTLTFGERYLNKFVYNASNVSKLAVRGQYIYLLSRTTNELQVVDTELRDLIYKQPIANKPVDMLLLNNKLYILCASNVLEIFSLEDYAMIAQIKLSEDGFSKKLVKLPNDDVLLVTNVTGKKYYVFDMNKNAVLQTVDTNMYINDLQFMDRKVN